MILKIFKTAFKNFQTFLTLWVLLVALNQAFIFGGCFAAYCLIAAVPHTLIIALLLNYFYIGVKSEIAHEDESADKKESFIDKIEKKSIQIEKQAIDYNLRTKEQIKQQRKQLEERIKNRKNFNFDEPLKVAVTKQEPVKLDTDPVATKNKTKIAESGDPEVNIKHQANTDKSLVETVFITNSNTNKFQIKNSKRSNTEIYKSLYDLPLNFMFSYPELSLLQVYKEVCKSHNDKLVVYRKIEQKEDTDRFVWEGGAPAYHKTSTCHVLHSDFLNLEIPAEIQGQGKQSITRYRTFVKQNSKLLKENESSFIDKLEARFMLKNRPKSITHQNSGSNECKNFNLEELKRTIDGVINSAQSYMKSDKETSGIIENKGYGTHKVKEAKIEGHPLHRWHQYKVELKHLLKEYYQVRFNPELKFERTLLDQVGFIACKHCYEN